MYRHGNVFAAFYEGNEENTESSSLDQTVSISYARSSAFLVLKAAGFEVHILHGSTICLLRTSKDN